MIAGRTVSGTRRRPRPEACALVAELLAYEIRVTPHTGAFTAGAFGTKHDDLATALGLAVLEAVYSFQIVSGILS